MQLLTKEEIRQHTLLIGDLSDQLLRRDMSRGRDKGIEKQIRNLRAEVNRHHELKELQKQRPQDRISKMLSIK